MSSDMTHEEIDQLLEHKKANKPPEDLPQTIKDKLNKLLPEDTGDHAGDYTLDEEAVAKLKIIEDLRALANSRRLK